MTGTTQSVSTSLENIQSEIQANVSTTVLESTNPLSQTWHNSNDASGSMIECKVTTGVLGAVIGILTMTLTVVSLGWGWTYWLLRRGVKRSKILHSG